MSTGFQETDAILHSWAVRLGCADVVVREESPDSRGPCLRTDWRQDGDPPDRESSSPPVDFTDSRGWAAGQILCSLQSQRSHCVHASESSTGKD